MVARLDPQPGQTILELGAGTGETGFAAARLIGDSGRLISTDLPPAMVEVAKRRAEELGVGNAEFRVVDAEHIDLEDSSVAGILCRWAYMLMPDPPAALADSDGLRDLLSRAGFDDVQIEEMEFHLRFTDFEDYWNFVREFAGAVAILLRSFFDEERAAVREATERATEPFRTAEGYDLPGLSVNALAS
jgi:tRNA A58 N-methylase Trm61